MVGFSNSDVGLAVEAKYIKGDSQKAAAHKNVATFFMELEDSVAERRVH